MSRYVICEDNISQAKNLCDIIKQRNEKNDVSVFYSGIELRSIVKSIKEDTIFLMDIVLDDVSGIDIAKEINKYTPNSVIIFISAFLEKVTEIYDATHCYFVFKQDLEKRLPAALDKAEKILKETKSVITIPTKEKTIILKVSDIRYIERIQRTSFIYCSSGFFQCHQNMEYFIKQLTSNFVQTHRSYIVNFHSVQLYKRTDLTLYDGSLIPISRAYAKQVKTKFQEYIMKKVQ